MANFTAIESPLQNWLGDIERLDWTASGYERWLAAGIVAALGLLAITTQGLYLSRTDAPASALVVTAGVPVLLSLFIIAAAVWLPGSDYGRYLPRISFWCLGGAVVLVAFGQLVLLSQRVLGTTYEAPLFVLTYRLTTGTAIGLVIGVYDAASETRKDQLDAERERAERYAQQLDVLARILRHDLRTGVQVIQQHVDLLPNPPDIDPEIPVNNIRNRANEMHQIAETTSEVQELFTARDQVTAQLDVTEKLDTAVATVEDGFPDAAVEFGTREPAELTASKLLDIAFEELLWNALEHNDSSNPEVEISCRQRGEAVEVEIADNGPGIPDEELEPLWQGRETQLVHSSGMGLWLANWIVQDSGGSLSFESNDAGGTTVTVRLPR